MSNTKEELKLEAEQLLKAEMHEIRGGAALQSCASSCQVSCSPGCSEKKLNATEIV